MNVSFINCCAVPLHYIAHSFCPATLNGVLGSCLQKSKSYRGVPEPPGTPPPYAPVKTRVTGKIVTFYNVTKIGDGNEEKVTHEGMPYFCMPEKVCQRRYAVFLS